MNDKTIFITGGTGSLGTALVRRFLAENAKKIIVYSRDEYKQRHMMSDLKTRKVEFVVGDVRDGKHLINAMRNVNYVVHTAALKHVPVGEEQPEETIKTNIIGTLNLVYACKKNYVEKAILTATDKGCHPINLYGASKLVGEKLFIAANQTGKTVFACVRYGNVIGSRGSVIETIKYKKPKVLEITDKRMTRFWLSLEQAVNLVIKAIAEARPGEIFVPKAPAMSVYQMFKTLAPETKLIVTGMRPGEKLHESMINKDESIHTTVYNDHFVIEPELLGVEYSNKQFEYTSENCKQLSQDEFLDLVGR